MIPLYYTFSRTAFVKYDCVYSQSMKGYGLKKVSSAKNKDSVIVIPNP